MMKKFYHAAFLFLLLTLLLPGADAAAQAVRTRTVIGGLVVPWEITWGPDNWIWMTERGGDVSRVDPETGERRLLLTIPDVFRNGDGGLLGMALHPGFADTPSVYLAYTYFDNGDTRLRLARYTYNGTTLTNPVTLLEGIRGSGFNNGGRLLISPDRCLFLTTGDARVVTDTTVVHPSQSHTDLSGKILRMWLDGSMAQGNPFPTAPYPYNLIWTTGHRNPLGLTYESTGQFYASEHGYSSSNEINLLAPGGNFGWPRVDGLCNRPEEMQFCQDSSVVEPIKVWNTVEVAGLQYYGSPAIPEWSNSLLAVTLAERDFRVLKLGHIGATIASETVYFNNMFGRLRDICVSPDGRIFISTSNRDGVTAPLPGDDRIIEIKPLGSQLPAILSVDFPDTVKEKGSFELTITTQGTFGEGNRFIVQQSDRDGSFQPNGIFPVTIRTIESTTGGTWKVGLDCSSPLTSSRYANIRVIATAPADTFSDGHGLVMSGQRARPKITPEGSQQILCAGDSLVLSAPPGMEQYRWSTGATTESIAVRSQGLYDVTVTGFNECPITSESIYVTVPDLISPLVIVNENELSTAKEFAGYQWLRDGEPIPGATGRSYTATVSGNYSVLAKDSATGCSAESGAFEIIVAGVELNNELTSALSVFPQPARDRSVIALGLAKGGRLEILVRDIRGTTVARFEDEDAVAGAYRREISTADLAPGVYFLTVTVGGKSGQVKLVKE